jgi:hypothetical protein
MRLMLFSLGCVLASWLPTAAAVGPPTLTRGGDDHLALAARLDARLAARWPRTGFEPAPMADDAEFLRRVSLDIAGVIPRAFEVRDFLDDPSPDKRRRLVDRLLASPDYIRHFASVFRYLLLDDIPRPDQESVRILEGWLSSQIREGFGYDQIIRKVLAAPLNAPRRVKDGVFVVSPLPFYDLRRNRLEDLASATARLFLGVKLECAECHNHPFARWTRTQFWEYAAFFAEVRPVGQPPAADTRSLTIPGTSRRVMASYPDGSAPRWQPGDQPRDVLARWVVARNNPFFARAAVNRLWAEFFGVPLVEDLDTAEANELLDDLAREFAGHHFDIKYLIWALTATKAYQRTSRLTHPGHKDASLFARMSVRGLSPEQLTASVIRATGYREGHRPAPRKVVRGVVGPTALEEFQAHFADWRNRADSQTTPLQALQAMNGRFIAEVVRLDRGEAITVVADARGLDAAGRVEQLFLATLSRRPRAEERDRFTRYVRSGGPRQDPRAALADIFWALLNSAEFMLNH